MPVNEFELIARYFAPTTVRRADVDLGIGDDGAVLSVPAGQQLVVTMDTLIAGVHFPEDTPPGDIGFKALAVNLSDLAAMGAAPAWATMALTVPNTDGAWLEGFGAGFFELATRHGVQLVGGDITRGRLSITIQAHGLVSDGTAITRRCASVGDRICVTGTLGDAALGLLVAQGRMNASAADACFLMMRLNRPTPRIECGVLLREIATAAIDISDGLAADLGHLLDARGLGATLSLASLPLSPAFSTNAPDVMRWQLALAGGDDYELCFTIPDRTFPDVAERFSRAGYRVTSIGRIESQPGLRCILPDGSEHSLRTSGFRHF
jgi:thiamine-monophosphate kinase